MGCLASKPASPESTFLRRISVEHFGVLGKRSVGPGFGTEEAAGPRMSLVFKRTLETEAVASERESEPVRREAAARSRMALAHSNYSS